MSRCFVCSKCEGPKDHRAAYCIRCTPRKVTDASHGDARRYYAGCRCDLCRRANSDYAAKRKQKNPEAVRNEQRRYWAKNKDRINSVRRVSKKLRSNLATALVKRRYRQLGALIELVDANEIRSDFLVYALVDPTNLAVRYVGVSSSGLSRPKQHGLPSCLSSDCNKRKVNWIHGLQSKGLNYAIRILEYFSDGESAHATEPYWIHWFRSQGEHLYNLTAGDDTQITVSPETKEKMRKIMKGRVITWGDKISATKKGKGNFRHKRRVIAKGGPGV